VGTGIDEGPRGAGRPRATSRDALEQLAVELLLEEGYDQVSVGRIAEAAGIGRTTFFRYFPSKADVVWGAFATATERLARLLDDVDPAVPTMTAVSDAVVGSTRGAVDDRGVWLERFQLLDTSPALRASAAEHWTAWQATVAAFVAGRTGATPGDVVPAAVAGAVQGTYVAELRSWMRLTTEPDALLERLRGSLETVGGALDLLLVPAPD
jgi:AcrR family transcriptional regulator